MKNLTQKEIEHMSESLTIEFKSAQEGVPKSFFETYSAFANSEGGRLFFGIEEKNGRKNKILGLDKPIKLKEDIVNSLNNKQKVNINLVQDSDFFIHEFDNKAVLEIRIPKATRKQKPVYINNNPLTGTYRRDFSGDYRCDDIAIRQMLRDQDLESYDSEVLDSFTLNDLSEESINEYRKKYREMQSNTALENDNIIEFLKQIGAWRYDRQSKKEGPTKAGLLMFGLQQAIIEVFPQYFLDYQERVSDDILDRYLDRVCVEPGSVNNIFDFYVLVYKKFQQVMKNPFELESGRRITDTSTMKIIREAMVNSLIHADYYLPAAIQILKFPDRIEFRNPGMIRIMPEKLFHEYITDCRNQNLQRMFRFLGFAEQAGHGLYTIFKLAQQQGSIEPLIEELDLKQSGIHTKLTIYLPSDELLINAVATKKKVRPASVTNLLARADVKDMEQAVLLFCQDDFQTASNIAEALNRKLPTVKKYIKQLLSTKKLVKKYKQSRHPSQAYKTKA